MQVTPGLERVLSALADHYLLDDNHAGADNLRVEFTDDTPHAGQHGQYVAVNPDVKDTYGRSVDGVTQLRIIVDTLAHEVEHVNQSDLMSKQEVAEANPDMPQAAGMVANILEDAYIDEQRMDRNPGQRVSYNAKIDALMGNHHRRPRLDSLLDDKGLPNTLIETALQVTAAGYGKGLEDMDPDDDTEGDLLEFAARWKHIAELARNTHDPDDRMDVVQAAVDLLREYAPDGTAGRDMDDAADQQGGGNLFDDDDAPDPQDLGMDPQDLERDQDVGDNMGGGDDAPDVDDLADELDSLGDDGWDGDDPDDADPDDTDGDGADGGDDGDGAGDTGDPDEQVDSADTPDDGGAGAGDTQQGDTSRIDRILGDYSPDELEVTD